MIKISVIISFFNRIDYLKLVLAGFARQVFCNFEIIIADDGSNPEVTNEIEILAREIPLNSHIFGRKTEVSEKIKY